MMKHTAIGILAAMLAAMQPALSDDSGAGTQSHGISAFGDLKYPEGFKSFEYVNPDAPKGGSLSLIGQAGLTTFNSFNAFILKGDPAQGIGLCFDSLMVQAKDEPDSYYGLVARAAAVAQDRKSVTFWLRPEARFSDGSKVTADDVVFSFEAIKKDGHPLIRYPLRDVVRVEKIDDHTVKYVFQGAQLRDLPGSVATLPVLSKDYYRKHDFTKTTLTPPVGSGPYRVGDFKPGRYVTYERREDYWARDLNVNRGRYNFDKVRYEFFRDRNIELENLKAGVYDLREEFTSRVWATGYDFAAVREGRMQLLTLADDSPSGAQGFFLNTRRGKLADVRVRKALSLVFDFPWTNRRMFYGLYKRTESYFQGSQLKADGPASAGEAALIAAADSQITVALDQPPETPPESDGSGHDRRLMRQAQLLLAEAGWQLRNGQMQLTNQKGETLKLEFLIDDDGFERVIAPYVRNLRTLGIDAWIRVVDAAQYQRRVKSYEFDVVVSRFIMRLTPGAELLNYFSSTVARQDGSRNLAGIQDPLVDKLIDKAMEARKREELVTAIRALDRVLRAGHYWVPQWYKAAHNIAYWDKFSRPKIKPKYDRGVVDTWWYDAEKAAKLARQ
ncbi:MAG: hypothetical protein RLZ98_464 [Pseudomonadota bacterium]|jgi:microcin C transport system substrate-binding protein